MIFLFEISVYFGIGKIEGWYQEDYIERTDFSLDKIEDGEFGFSFRKPCGLEYKKQPILLYGCSFTYGDGLKDNENFSYILSKTTKRPVYNFGLSGKGMQHSLHIMQNHPKISPEPQYIIYTFLQRQIRRLYMECVFIGPFNFYSYEYKNGVFVPKESNFNFIKNTM